MTTVQRRLPVTFTDPTGLPFFRRAAVPFSFGQPLQRFSAYDADVAIGAAVTSLPNIGTDVGDVLYAAVEDAPTLRQDVRGIPYLEFDGVNDRLRSSKVLPTSLQYGAFTVYAVARPRDLATSGPTSYDSMVTLTDGEIGCINYNNAGQVGVYRGGSGAGGTPATAAKNTTATIGTGVLRTISASYSETATASGSTGSAIVNIDGATQETLSPLGVSAVTMTMESGAGNSTNFAAMDLYEVGVFPGVLSQANIDALHDELRETYKVDG